MTVKRVQPEVERRPGSLKLRECGLMALGTGQRMAPGNRRCPYSVSGLAVWHIVAPTASTWRRSLPDIALHTGSALSVPARLQRRQHWCGRL